MNFQSHGNTPEVWEEKNLVFADVVRVVKKYVWLAGVLSIGLGTLTFVWSKKQPKKYDATAIVEVDQHNGPNLANSITVSDEFELKITTDILALQSHDVSTGVIKRLKLESNKLFNQNYPRFAPGTEDPVDFRHLPQSLARAFRRGGERHSGRLP